MKKLMVMLCGLLTIILFNNCSSGKYVVSENGDIAEVGLKDGREFVSEILIIQDTAIIFATTSSNPYGFPTLFFQPINEIKSINIQGYDGSGWGGSVLLFQVLPAVILTVTAASVSSENVAVGLIFAIPAAVSALLFATSEGETPQWNDELPVSELGILKKYSRYPKGVSVEELTKLLKRYNQTALKKYL